MAERELEAFVSAVAELFGPEQEACRRGLAGRIDVDGRVARIDKSRLAADHRGGFGTARGAGKCFFTAREARLATVKQRRACLMHRNNRLIEEKNPWQLQL